MIEMRWLVYEEEETLIPPTSQIRFGEPFQKVLATKKKLQYRQMIDTTVRAGGAGTWDHASIVQTANIQWSNWKDVPDYVERDMNCP